MRITLRGGPLDGKTVEVADEIIQANSLSYPVFEPEPREVWEAPPPGETFKVAEYRRTRWNTWEWCGPASEPNS